MKILYGIITYRPINFIYFICICLFFNFPIFLFSSFKPKTSFDSTRVDVLCVCVPLLNIQNRSLSILYPCAYVIMYVNGTAWRKRVLNRNICKIYSHYLFFLIHAWMKIYGLFLIFANVCLNTIRKRVENLRRNQYSDSI